LTADDMGNIVDIIAMTMFTAYGVHPLTAHAG